jgi:hypothetical protein
MESWQFADSDFGRSQYQKKFARTGKSGFIRRICLRSAVLKTAGMLIGIPIKSPCGLATGTMKHASHQRPDAGNSFLTAAMMFVFWEAANSSGKALFHDTSIR